MDSIVDYFISTDHEIPHVKINQNKLAELKERYRDVSLFRQRQGCHCDDALCPHKSSVDLMLLTFIQQDLVGLYEFDGDLATDFKPTQTPAKNVSSLHSYAQLKEPIHYNRFCMPIKINGVYEVPRRPVTIVEGIEFTTKVDDVTVEINGNEFTFKTKNNSLWLHDTFLPMKELPYTIIKILTDAEGILYFGDCSFDLANYFDRPRILKLAHGNDYKQIMIDSGVCAYW
jgi:hypothetical protein